jgi:hypothetical protein
MIYKGVFLKCAEILLTRLWDNVEDFVEVAEKYWPLFRKCTKCTVGFKKNGNCQKKFCQILLNFYSLKRPFRI